MTQTPTIVSTCGAAFCTYNSKGTCSALAPIIQLHWAPYDDSLTWDCNKMTTIIKRDTSVTQTPKPDIQCQQCGHCYSEYEFKNCKGHCPNENCPANTWDRTPDIQETK